MNFIVTSLGRSGTAFLANALNTSPTWTVNHEQPGDHVRMHAMDVQPRFNRNGYGEVNSQLRYMLCELDVSVKAVLLRDPLDIVLSGLNKHPEWLRDYNELNAFLERVCNGLIELDRYARYPSIMKIGFRDITTSKGHIIEIGRLLGIHDLKVDGIDMDTKINSGSKWLNALPRFVLNQCECLEWFREKWIKS